MPKKSAPKRDFSMGASNSIPPPQSNQGFHPPTHGNYAQWATVIAALLFGVANLCLTIYFHHSESASKSSDEHINSLIGDSIDKKLTPIVNQLADLGTRVGKLEGRFEQLDADQKRLTKIQLNKLSVQLALTKQSHRPMNVATLISLGESVAGFSNSTDQGVSQLAWRTRLQIIDYRSFLNTAVAPKPGTRDLIDLEHGRSEDLYVELDARKIPDAQTAKFGYVGFGKVFPAGSPEGALFLRIGNEDKANATTQHFYLGAIGFELKLDGYHIRNAIINGARIVYSGGPLILENVYFVNCTFEMPPTPQSQELANAILDHAPASFSPS